MNTKTSRREFIKASTLTAGAMFTGCLSATPANPQPAFIWSALVHLGFGMWGDNNISPNLRFDEEFWKDLSERLRAAGANQIILDLGEGLVYPSHPELAVNGSWSPEKMRGEIERLRRMGFEVIPKVNFSSAHDAWLRDYSRMLSTPAYYKACREIIGDVAEIFDHPRFIHLGYDEETAEFQTKERGYPMVIIRQGELWWHDYNWFVEVTKAAGSRPWIWCDYMRRHPDEFWQKMSKDSLMSPWDYSGPLDPAKNKKTKIYIDLDKAGYDQVICSSNCYEIKEKHSDIFLKTVKFCEANLSKAHLKGYMHAPWCRTVPDFKNGDGSLCKERWAGAVANIAAAVKFVEGRG